MHHRFVSVLRLGLLIVLLTGMFGEPQQAKAGGIVAGFSEYYLPGAADQLFAILADNNAGISGTLHNVITIPIATDNVTVYYDHWENGYGNGISGSDESYTVNRGTVLTFISDVPTSGHSGMNDCTGSTFPAGGTGGSSTHCYDGRDRIYVVGGAVSVAQAFWPTTTGTVYADAWEVYPVKPYAMNYTIPAGEDLYGAPRNYTDFQNVYVLIQATQDGTVLNVDNKNPAPGRPEAQDIMNLSMNRGEVTQVYDVWAGTTVSASKPVQVQFIVGRQNAGYDSRSHTAVPTSLWDTKYYSPVPTQGGTNVNLYLFNPTSSPLTINYQDTTGSGSFVLPANSTRSYQEMAGRYVPDGSGVYLAAADGATKFWTIGEYDTGSATRNWGFSLIPAKTLTSEYIVSWAPGTSDPTPTANGSPIFVSPTQDNTTIFVDYSPADGIADATYTLNRLQVQKIRDPDNVNTGTRVWATAPFAIVWGEDAQFAGTGNPYIDAGYTILPLNADWIDVVLSLDKTSNPSSISAAIGQAVAFTLSATSNYPMSSVDMVDDLPTGWAYVPNSTMITLPDGTIISGAAANPAISGQKLTWSNVGNSVGKPGMNAGESLSATFQAQTTAIPGNYSINSGTVTGTSAGQTFTATDTTTVVATSPDLSVTKTNDLASNALVGSPFDWELEVLNGSSSGAATFTTGQTILRDNLPAGPTYGSVTVTNGATAPTGTIACAIAANVLNCAASGGSVTLPTGASFTVSFPVTPASAGTLTNPATGGGNVCQVDPLGVIMESSETNNTCSNTVTVVAPSMSMTKTANPASGTSVGLGSTLTYTVTVNNTGGTTQNNVVINDALPAGTTYGSGQLTYPVTYTDSFNAQAYNNNNGTKNFSANWVESDGVQSATAGNVQVVADGALQYVLRVGNNTNAAAPANGNIYRVVGNLSACTTVNLNFDYRAAAALEAADHFYVDVSADGGANWAVTPAADLTNLAINAAYTANPSVDLTAQKANLAIRFRSAFADATLADTETLYVDNIRVTCSGLILASHAPTNMITAADNIDLPADTSMSLVYTVTVDTPVPAGQTSVDNTASVFSDDQLVPLTSATTHPIAASADLTVTKSNNVSGSAALGSPFNWTIDVSNVSTGSATFADTQTILSDTLPGVAGYYPQGAVAVTNGSTAPAGTINCSITGIALACVASGAVTFPAAASFSVTFAVTPTATGSLANTATVDPNGNVTELDETNNSSTNTVVVVGAPSISKSFSPNPTIANVNSTLTFTITNPNTSTILNGVAFSDTYPTGLVNATPLATTNTCGGTLNATAGGGMINLSGGMIASNGSCTITVSVVAAAGGTYANTTGNVSSTNGGTGNTASSTLTVFDASPSKSIVTTSEPSTGFVSGSERVTIGEMVRYQLVSHIPEGTFTNVQLLDGIPNGLQFLNDNTATVAFVCNSGAACMTSSTLSGAGLVVDGASSNVSPTFAVPGAAISGGPFGSGTDVTFSLGNVTNSDADSDSEYAVLEFNALVLNVNGSATINQGTDNQTGIDVPNNRQNDVTLRVNGSTVGSASPNATVDIAEPAITSFTKSVSPATGPYLPGDVLTYTLVFSNTTLGNQNAATAFDVVLSDTFDSSLSLGAVNVSSTQGASCAGGTAFTTSNSTVGQLVTVNVSCLDPGKTFTVTIDATIGAAISSDTNIANSSSLTYTSLPGPQGNCGMAPFTCSGVGASGSGTGERNGSGGTGTDGTILNNYAFTSNTVNTSVTYGSITIVLDNVPDNAQDFSYTGSGPNGYNFGGGFSLDDDADGTLPNTQTFVSLVPGTYTLTQGIVNGWSLTGLTCVDPDSGSTTDLGTATATIDLDAGENVVCTYTNTQWSPSIVLTKTPTLDDAVVAPGGVVDAGDTITYAFSVQNTGNVTITNINVADPLLPALSCTIASLVPTASASCVAANNVYTLTQSDIDAGTRVNTATATGKDPGNNDVTDSDIRTVAWTQEPTIDVVKSSTTTSITAAAQIVPYTFTVTNTGNETLTGIDVSDPMCDAVPVQQSGDTNNDNQLQTTETWVYTCSHTVSQAELDAGGNLSNTVIVGSNEGASDTDTLDIPVTQSPALTILKSEISAGPYSVNDTITYDIVVTNTGNKTLTGVVVTDNSANVGTCTSAQPAVLTPNAIMTCPASHVVTQADVDSGSYVNIATGDSDQTLSSTSTVTINFPRNPALTITKSELSTGPYAANSTINYRIVVTNTGNTTLTNVFVADPKLTPKSNTCASVAPLGTCVLNGAYTATQADIDAGSFTNTASVTDDNVCPAAGAGTCEDTVTVNFTPNPDITIVKSSNATGSNAINDVITYTFDVQNAGNVTLTNVNVTDAHSGLSAITCIPAQGSSLAPSDTMECTATYAVTQADVDAGHIDNTGVVTGAPPTGPNVTANDPLSVSVARNHALTINKTETSTGPYSVNDAITFSVVVTNTGNATLTNVVVSDPDLTPNGITCASLAPLETCVLNGGHTVTQADIDSGSFTNTGSVTDDDVCPAAGAATCDAKVTVTFPKNPGLAIVKEVSNSSNGPWNDTSVAMSVGDTVYYRVRVSNTGNTTLTGLTVDDGMPGCTLARGTDITGNNDNNFEVGEEWVYTCSTTAVAGTNNNTATADTNETPQVSDSASYVAGAALVADPALSKSGSPTQATVGETVTFTLTITNKGNAPAPNVVVTDALLSIFDVTAVNVDGAPVGTLVDVTPLIGTGPAPYTVVVTLGGDLAVTDVVTIQIVTKVNSLGNPPINNSATLTTSASADILSNDSDSVSINVRNPSGTKKSLLPATGFAKGIRTILGPQPSDLNYAATDVMLEIPSLGVKVPIVGVPQKDGIWNLSWLGNQAGWLQGTAFPSWSGNSVLTGHVYMASGLPGPFVNLNKLKYGDKIIVHAYGQKYTFAVQTNTIVAPDDQSVMKHEDESWVTLVTCKDYDEQTRTYLSRVVVRAILVRVDWE